MSALFDILIPPAGAFLLAGLAAGLAFVRSLRAPVAARVRASRPRRSR